MEEKLSLQLKAEPSTIEENVILDMKNDQIDELEINMEQNNELNNEQNIALSIEQEDKAASVRGEALSSIQLVKAMKTLYQLPDTDIRSYSPLTLAFIGDGIFDLVIRTIVVENGNAPVNKLHQKVSKLVQASAQVNLFHQIKDLLTEQEMTVYKRGRNAKSHTSAKNADIVDYRIATGLEALMGYLYLTDQMDRLLYLIKPNVDSNNK